MSNRRTTRYPVEGMGTTLQYSVDLLDTFRKNNTNGAINNSDYWEFIGKRLLQSTQTGPDQFQNSMDILHEQYDRESMRMIMLKHEETFKYQVRELHRLYKVQKMLMDELQNNKSSPQATRVGPISIDTDNRIGSETNCSPFYKWSHPSNQTNSGHNFHQLLSLRAYPSSREHTTSCLRDDFRIPKDFDLERPAEEIYNEGSPMEKNKMSVNNSRDPHLYHDVESEVDLTLSIGFGTSKNKPNNHQPHSRIQLGCSGSNNNETRHADPSSSIRSDRGEERSSVTIDNIGTANATFDRESLQQPPWILQTLS